MQKKYFITGISTEVGKTIVSAIITEALQADYWKPIQAGDLENGDKEKVQNLITNQKSIIHKNSFALTKPMSPHAAALRDKIEIRISSITEPKTKNHLVIEGAGGLLVPLSTTETIADLIQADYQVILVSKHYLGSINHTLLSYQYLKSKGINCSIVFVGDEHSTTENIIREMTNANIIGRVPMLKSITKESISRLAQELKPNL